MANFGALKINKTEKPDKSSFTLYYPNINGTNQTWTQNYIQFVSIDPGRKNYAMRIERRYHNGYLELLAFDKQDLEEIDETADVISNHTYQNLTYFLDKYGSYWNTTHIVIVERQLPQNYKAVRISQHTISYFMLMLRNSELRPLVVEINPKVKGKILKAPKELTEKQLKKWAVEKATELLTTQGDTKSLEIMSKLKKKDDVADTVCQIEALCRCWKYPSIPDAVVPTSSNTPQLSIIGTQQGRK